MGNKVSGKTGGTLRRGWTTQAEGSGAEGLDSKSAVQFVDTLKVNHFGDTYVIEVRNSVEYASYIEFGHRKANHKAGCLDTTCLPCPRKKSAMRHQGFFGKSSISG